MTVESAVERIVYDCAADIDLEDIGAMIRTCGSREDAPSRMMIFDETGF